MRYQFYQEQHVDSDRNTVWSFFTQPSNLIKLSPPDLHFKHNTEHLDTHIYSGMELTHTLSPLLNIPISWTTRITEIVPEHCFVDRQIKGPFSYWEHRHEFFDVGGATLIKDYVSYQLPFGGLGRLVHRLIVRNKLEAVFAYRYHQIDKEFNSKKETV